MSASSLTTAAAGPRRALAVTLVGLLLVAVSLYFFWPLGVVLGVALGLLVVSALGRQQEREARILPVEDLFAAAPAPVASAPAASAPRPAPVAVAAPVVVAASVTDPEPKPVEGVRADLVRLKADLGDDYPDFARAARLVVSTQYASAARLQRDLHLPYSRARRLLADLETEHFVGPATGTLPRQVLLPKERLPEVERLFAGV